MSDRLNYRILEIDFTVDQSDDDIEELDAVTYFRDAQSRTAGNGHAIVDVKASDGEGGTRVAVNTSIGTVELWIWLPEQIPAPNVIVLDMAVTA